VSAKRDVTLLRFVGGVCVLAAVAVILPQSALAAVHESAGLGHFPDEPIAE
jgi:hypothetical protein